MKIDWKVPETKSQFIASSIEQEVSLGKLAPGSRLPAMRDMAKQFSVSLKVAQSAFEILNRKGLIDCRHGSGTFVRKREIVSHNNESSTIYYLTPHPIHTTLHFEPSIIDRRIIYGVSMNRHGCLLHNIPVSKNMEGELNNIDWVTVNQIPEGAKVFVGGLWYRKLFPFLKERNAKVINRFFQYEMKFPEDLKYSADCGWYTFVIDRTNATEQAVEYLYGLGRRRIGLVKFFKDEFMHPFRIGMMDGYENCGISFEECMYHEIASSSGLVDLENEIENEVIDFWKKTRFDSLVIGNAAMFKTVYNTLTSKLGLRIPEDVALLSFTDHPDYLDTKVPVSAIDFPWVSAGREIVKCFNRKIFTPGKTIFQAHIIERESTRKGAGAFVNHNFMPERSIVNNEISYHKVI